MHVERKRVEEIKGAAFLAANGTSDGTRRVQIGSLMVRQRIVVQNEERARCEFLKTTNFD
jgi:hypothetical protein